MVPTPESVLKTRHDTGPEEVLGILSTSNYDFMALGHTKKQVATQLRKAWNKHRKETGATMTWAEVHEDVNYVRIAAGWVLRDGERLI